MWSRVKGKSLEVLKWFDFFSTNELLRYNGDKSYSTATGGTCSIIIIVIFCVLFVNMGIRTVNMEIINWSSNSAVDQDPSLTTVKMYPASKFMFAIGILGLNLASSSIRYFDVTMVALTSHTIIPYAQVNVSLVKCTSEHFAGLNTENPYSRLNLSRWLCPPLNYSFDLQGKYSSNIMNRVQIDVRHCNPATEVRPCAPIAVIDAIQAAQRQFTLSVLFINPLINPSQSDYLSYSLLDNIFITFSRKLGTFANVEFMDFQIDTDTSIWPVEQHKFDEGLVINEQFKTFNYLVENNTGDVIYGSFIFLKSSSSISYSRSFNKLDNFFSYIGGLVGIIFGCAFILNSFQEMAFEIQVADHLFSRKPKSIQSKVNQPPLSLYFNFFTYLKYRIYCMLASLGCEFQWKDMERYARNQEEVQKQLDVSLLIERIAFLERSLELMIEDYHFRGLHLVDKPTVEEANQTRQHYLIRQKIQHFKEQNKLIGEAEMASYGNLKSKEQQKSIGTELSTYNINMVNSDSLSIKDTNSDIEHVIQAQRDLKKIKQSLKEDSLMSKRILERLDPSYVLQPPGNFDRMPQEQNTVEIAKIIKVSKNKANKLQSQLESRDIIDLQNNGDAPDEFEFIS